MSEQLIQFELKLEVLSGQQFGSATFSVPAGKRLLIDYVSADIRLPSAQRGSITIHTRPPYPGSTRVSVPHFFFLTPAGASISAAASLKSHFVSQRTRLFTEQKLEVLLARGQATTQLAGGIVSISGRLVDIT